MRAVHLDELLAALRLQRTCATKSLGYNLNGALKYAHGCQRQ